MQNIIFIINQLLDFTIKQPSLCETNENEVLFSWKGENAENEFYTHIYLMYDTYTKTKAGAAELSKKNKVQVPHFSVC